MRKLNYQHSCCVKITPEVITFQAILAKAALLQFFANTKYPVWSDSNASHRSKTNMLLSLKIKTVQA